MRWAIALGSFLLACSKPSDPQVTNPEPSATSRSSAQRAPIAQPASSLDMAASEGGWGLHAGAAKGCSDQKCIGQKCGPLCSQYVEERFKTFATVGQKNRLYFACFGSCIAGPPDGGRSDAGH